MMDAKSKFPCYEMRLPFRYQFLLAPAVAIALAGKSAMSSAEPHRLIAPVRRSITGSTQRRWYIKNQSHQPAFFG